jgi:hypothetical protein
MLNDMINDELLDEYQNSVIRFPKEGTRRNEYESVEVGIERSYQPNDMGNGGCSKTGPWVVTIKNGSCLSSGYVPAAAARKVADAICKHADECDRRNKATTTRKSQSPERVRV